MITAENVCISEMVAIVSRTLSLNSSDVNFEAARNK